MADPFRDPQPQTLDSVSSPQSRAARQNDAGHPLLSRDRTSANHARTRTQNPFADPAVQAGLHSHAHEDYDASLKTGGSTYSLPQTGGGGAGGEDMQARLADLQRREQELAVSLESGPLTGTRLCSCGDLSLDRPLTRSHPLIEPGICTQGEAGAHPQAVSALRIFRRVCADTFGSQRPQQLASRSFPSPLPQHRVRGRVSQLAPLQMHVLFNLDEAS